jgi:hypothetical protein
MTETGRILAVGLMALAVQAGVDSSTGTRSAISRLPDGGISCSTWACGEKHNETLVNGVPTLGQADALSQGRQG